MNKQIEKSVPVSVIIPVFNVYRWIDQCMESVVHQTFSDFEVILINDGSTDGSDEKCRGWAGRDNRIHYISKKNEGPSPTRNLGIREAKGRYLVFIDADDWVDYAFVEKLYKEAVEQEADIVECDIWRYNDTNGEKTYHTCYGSMGRDYSLEEHVKYGNSAIWKCLIRKELFTKYNIVFPDCHSEARAIYALLFMLSKKNVNVHEALYYYRRYRAGSLTAKPRTDGNEDYIVGVKAFDCLINNFKRCNIYNENKELLERMIKYRLSDLLAAFFPRKETEEFKELADNYYDFIQQKFPHAPNEKYIVFGGYNLNRILWHVNLLHNPYCRFNFSSLISLMNPMKGNVSCYHKNRYREMMLEREMQNQFWSILEEVKPKYIFLDFIEERFDLIEYKSGYLTKSDAYDEADISIRDPKIIVRDSEECYELWKQSSTRFIQRFRETCPQIKIVLIRNFLSEKVGDIYSQSYYNNVEDIRAVNSRLKKYYDYFEANCENLCSINASECCYYFTDKQYEYGAIPSHLNEIVNDEIARKIERAITL